jgi:hypothetical protein
LNEFSHLLSNCFEFTLKENKSKKIVTKKIVQKKQTIVYVMFHFMNLTNPHAILGGSTQLLAIIQMDFMVRC